MLAQRFARFSEPTVRYAAGDPLSGLSQFNKQTPFSQMQEALSNWLRAQLYMHHQDPTGTEGLFGKELTPEIASLGHDIHRGNVGALGALIEAMKNTHGSRFPGTVSSLTNLNERLGNRSAVESFPGRGLVPVHPELHEPWMNTGHIPESLDDATRIFIKHHFAQHPIDYHDMLKVMKEAPSDIQWHLGRELQRATDTGALHPLLNLNRLYHLHTKRGPDELPLYQFIEHNVNLRQDAERKSHHAVAARELLRQQPIHRPGEMTAEDYYALSRKGKRC